ncbi:hypothetical protein V6U81_26465 [Micromonospora sp. CPCC 205711]|uniref:hypothetical protein n=1 Tax=Micromonospora sp. CPCC 205547 TaxID=3122400 RepID=UPI002FF2E323
MGMMKQRYRAVQDLLGGPTFAGRRHRVAECAASNEKQARCRDIWSTMIPVKPAEALARMRDAAALWSVGYASGADLVDAACDLLITGHDGPNLSMLAGVHSRHADEEVPELLEAALQDVGLDYHSPCSEGGQEAAVRTMAARVLAGALEPLDLATWAHTTIGHGTLALAEHLVELDDVYDTLEYTNMTEQDLNAEILAEARRIVGAHPLVEP